MGTNYYMVNDPCEHCGRGDALVHIGKTSSGWVMILRSYEDGPGTWAEWKEALLSADRIEDEYGKVVSAPTLIANAEKRADLMRGRRDLDCQHDGPVDLYDRPFS